MWHGKRERDSRVASDDVCDIAEILVYRSVVLVGKICIDGEHHGGQDREGAGCHYSILLFLQVGANQIRREIVPLGEQDDAGGEAHDHAHRRENESLCRSERYPVSVRRSLLIRPI